MAKQHYGRELWERMREFVKTSDGLPTTELGIWTAEKLWFVGHYLAIVSHASSGIRRSFSGINYIDLFCGNGVCEASTGSRTERFPGSPLLAAGCPKPFDKLILVDRIDENLAALTTRMSRLDHCPSQWHKSGDANVITSQVIKQIPSRSLSIAFFDPFSLEVHFSTICDLARGRQIDLIILFPDAIDIVRNVEKYYYPRKSPNLDNALCPDCDWRSKWDKLTIRDGAKVREFFANIYIECLRSLGFNHHDIQEIKSAHGPIYKLVFASKHPLGLKFWNIACSETLSGERGLFGF